VSAVAKIIDAVIAAGLAPAAKAAGFAKGGRNFWRAERDAVLVTNVQASRHNQGDAGEFTLNLGVYFPAVGARADLPARDPARPAEPDCQLRHRIGQLMSTKGDHWWQVDGSTNTLALATEVADIWRRDGLAWLEANRDLDDAADRIAASDRLFLGIQFRVAQGRTADAKLLLDRLQNDATTFAGHRQHVAAWATKHGLV